MRPITFAHGVGSSEASDGPLEGFRRVLELGARGIESDARLSSDGEVVLVHDAVVRRGLRRVVVERSTAARLSELGVPRLADLYAELGRAFELSLDVKRSDAGRQAVDLARRVGHPDRLWLCASDTTYLKDLRVLAPDIRIVQSTRRDRLDEPVERHVADLAAAGIDALNLRAADWTTGLVTLAHRFEVLAFAWDANEVRQLRGVLRMGVDAVYGNHVDRMVAAVEAWEAGV